MGFLVGIIKRLLKLILFFAIFVAIILLIPNLPPYTKFTNIEIEPTQQWIGPLAPNTDLNNAQRLYEDKLLGPEAFQIWNGEVYTGLATGEIVKVSPGGHVTFVTKIGQPCTGLVQEHICGRPLGFVIDEKNKLLYVADAYYGIWKVNLVTDKKQLLVSPKVPIDDPSGRLFYYNAAKNESKVLLDDLWFANGLVVSPDNQFVIVSETSRYRVVKYYINGSKKGTSEVFVAGLPGLPDNIRSLPDGSGVLVYLYNVFDDDHPLLTKTMAATPLVRKFLARLARLIEIPFELLNTQVPHYIFEEIVHYIGSFGSLTKLSSGMSGLVQLDWNGNIIAAYYNTDGSISHLSDAIVFNDKLFTGCPHIQNFIGAVPAPPLLKKAFSSNQVPVKKQQKPEEKIDVPKVNKPVVQKKPELKVNEKPKQAPQQTPPPVAKQPEKVQKEPQVKQNAVPKEKPKVASKEAEIKQNEIPKASHVKAKTIEKEAQKQKEPVAKAQPASKEPETKSKVVPNSQEKLKEPELKPKTAPEVQQKIKVDEKPNAPKVDAKPNAPKIDAKPNAPKVDAKPNAPKVDTKPSAAKKTDEPSKIKPVSKEAEPKAKPKEAEVKPKTPKESKESKNTNVDGSKEKVKKAEKPNVENEKPKKQIPVKEVIPSDTAKPSKEKLKVIKKSGPQEIPNPHL
ncbi:unnamed protein product, partial [Brenthis ino]